MSVAGSLVFVTLFVSVFGSCPARGQRLGGGRFDAVVAVAGGAVALRNGAAVFVDVQGRVRGRCPGTAPPAARDRPRARADLPDAEDVLRLAGLPDDDDGSPEAEETLEDEGLGLERARRATHAPPLEGTVARALAAAPDGGGVWIATSDGLWRAEPDGGGCVRVALGGRDVALVAAAGDRVAAVAGASVWRSADGGASFDVAAVLLSTPRALAVTADGGHTLVATDEAVLEPATPRAIGVILDRGARALAACGGAVMALAMDGAYLWTPGSLPARVGPGPPARSLSCSPATPTGPRWLAAGAGLWTTSDGTAWTEEPAGLGLSLAGAASDDGGWWLASDDALVRTAAAPAPGARGPGEPGIVRATESIPWHARAPATWAALLPRLGVALGGRRADGLRSEWHVWLLVTLPLGRASRHAADVAEMRALVARRRAALAVEELRLDAAARTGDDEAAALEVAADAERGALP